MSQTGREVMLDAINHRQGDRVPYRYWVDDEVAAQLDAHYGGHMWADWPEPFMRNVIRVDTIQERPIDALRARDAFGAIWRMDKRPWHLETPPLAEPSLEGYAFPDLRVFTDPIDAQRQAALKAVADHPDQYHIVDMGWGLFEQTWRIRGFENMLSDVVLEVPFYEELMDRLSDLYLGMVRACADIPADAFFFGDDWGEQRGVIIGPDRFRRLIKPYWRRVYDEVHRQGKRVISHCCGSVMGILPDLIDMGLDVLESVQPEAAGMEPLALKREYGRDIAFFGCVGTQKLMPFGTPAEIRAQVRLLREKMGEGGGFILSSAKPLQAGTPVENAVALLEAMVQG